MKTRTLPSGSRSLMVITTLLALAGTFASLAVNPFGAARRAKLANDLNNARQIKFALDGFATDFDGQYPNEDTSEQVIEGGAGSKYSNDYFRQLFLSGETNSEAIFWVKGAAVCNEAKPDDVVLKNGRLDPKQTLQAGDCGWAYVRDQVNVNNPTRPIVLSAFAEKTQFDKKLYRGKAIVIRIDGAAFAPVLDAKGRLTNKDGEDLLSSESKPWKGSDENPSKLLVQPHPKAQPKKAEEGGAPAKIAK